MIGDALDNLKILDITATIGGAYASRLLADLGAQVDRPTGSRTLYRDLNPSRDIADWEKGVHHALNDRKNILPVDVSTTEGMEEIRKLILDVHVVLEDVGLMDNEGSPLKWTHVQAINPSLTVLSVSPFGSSGPYKSYAASDLSLWAWSGMAWTTPGVPDTPQDLLKEPPLMPTGVSIPSIIGGVVAATSIIASGPDLSGQRISVSELEALVALNYHPVAQYEYLKEMWLRGPNILARQPNCYIPCKDGWIVLVSMSTKHWDLLLSAMDRPGWALADEFSDSSVRAANWDALEILLKEWTKERECKELTQDLQARGIPAYWSSSASDAYESEQIQYRKFLRETKDNDGKTIKFPGIPFQISNGKLKKDKNAEGNLEEPNEDSNILLPLKGIKIVDFGQFIAIPFAAKWLAALGADVIQVESRHSPFDNRTSPPFADDLKGLNRAAPYNVLNSGKRSISINLQTEEGRILAKKIAVKADIVMENYSTGLMERLGLGFEDLSKENPKIIYTSVSGFGRTGPLKDYRALHSIVNAHSGLAGVTGYSDDHPRLLGSYFPDVVSGLYAVFATITALRERDIHGHSQHIDLSMSEALMTLMLEPFVAMSTDTYVPGAQGNRHPLHAPHNVYPCQGDDQWVALSVRTDREWKGLCSALGIEHRLDSPFITAEGRKLHEDELDRLIESWARMRSKREAALALIRFGVPAAPILTPQELVNDPHIVDRGFIGPVDHPEVGIRRAASIPWRINGMIAGQQKTAPLVNQHTPKILTELFEMSVKEIGELAAKGVLT
jgi:crotonobetainyl-CoA:carnitine CoA-transferase CaiB-like acyl-CoA transferase